MISATLEPSPEVEALLANAHRAAETLARKCTQVAGFGIERAHLPEEATVLAFALLGDHGRIELLSGLSEHWPSLRERGLVHGSIAETSTPELRLLAHVLPLTDTIDEVWQRLRESTSTVAASWENFRCASSVRGLWGQTARLRFEAIDAAYVFVSPDPIFGLQPALLAGDSNGRCAGQVSIPVDNGVVNFKLLRRSGDIVAHGVQCVVAGVE